MSRMQANVIRTQVLSLRLSRWHWVFAYAATCYLIVACDGASDSSKSGPNNIDGAAGLSGQRVSSGGRDATGTPSRGGAANSSESGTLAPHTGLIRLNLKVK